MTILFNSKTKGPVTREQFIEKLKIVGASDCDVLYIHTDMSFGLPAIKRSSLLYELYGVLDAMNVGTLVFPTFTFSFCNQESYDINKTPTKMGTLNEYVRKNISGMRSLDPLLSVFVVGDKLNLLDNLGNESIGKNSNYERIHQCSKDVKFLFFGADMRECFTYTHYMETVFSVPYRYNREFIGDIIASNGEIHKNEKYLLFSTYGNCKLNSVPVVYNEMLKRNMLRIEEVGDSNLCCFTEKDSFKCISDLLTENIYCLTDGNFDLSKKNTIYNPNKEYIVSVK